MNFLGILGFNCESLLFDIKNLNEFEFGKSLFKIRNFYSHEEQDIKLLNYIINNYDLSKKDIRKIIENNDENNDDFTGKILRSMKRNKRDKSSILARKLGKHCKRVSTENKDKRKNVKYMHIYKLLKYFNFKKILSKTNRTVIHLDNVRAHKTDFFPFYFC